MKHEINVPKGCKVISVETTDEMVVVKFEKDESKFKENDIVATEYDVSIIDKINGNSFSTKVLYELYSQKLFIGKASVQFDDLRLATDSEKQLLFDKLKEKCLMFDGKDVIRWRAEIGGHYYCISSSRIDTRAEEHFFSDNENYNIGNYFPTKELAEQFQKQYLELLDNFHKNL